MRRRLGQCLRPSSIIRLRAVLVLAFFNCVICLSKSILVLNGVLNFQSGVSPLYWNLFALHACLPLYYFGLSLHVHVLACLTCLYLLMHSWQYWQDAHSVIMIGV